MALEIRSNQIRLADAFTFAGQVQVPAPSVDADAATKKYVDDEIAALAVPTGGDGINVDGSLVVSVDLATNSGLEFNTAKLQAKINAIGGLDKDSSGLRVKLETSNPTLKADGVSGELGVKYDAGMFQTSAGGLQIKNGGVGENQLAADSVTADKIGWSFEMDYFAGDGSSTSFNLGNTAHDAAAIMCFVNGQKLKRVASTPAFGEYTATASAITLGGTARDSNDVIEALYIG
jgi:hypothetical protein